MPPQDRHIRNILKLFEAHGYRHDRYSLFSDCMELTAISISNSVDSRSRADREARYLEIVGRYDRPTVEMLPQVFGEITMALEAAPGDVLGSIFTALEIHSRNRGQFFTPYPVCQMMAESMLGKQMNAIIEREGFVSVNEPACGAGAMVIALAQAMRASGINYQRHMHVTAIDIDPRAIHMAYIQFSLLHIPAVVVLGDALKNESREQWFTPAHVLGGWNRKLAKRAARAAENARSDTEHAPIETRDKPEIIQPGTLTPRARPVQLSLF